MKYRTLYFTEGKLRLIDQTLLPESVKYVDLRTHYEVHTAIKTMKVRGAPAIGIAAAYGVALAVNNVIKPNGSDPTTWEDMLEELRKAGDHLKESRPTAVNLQWAVHRMLRHAKDVTHGQPFDTQYLYDKLVRHANLIMEEDQRACNLIGNFGMSLIDDGTQVLTYCNAGSLAAAELGTALAPIYMAHRGGRKFNVYCCETRPLLQGARLTAWELMQSGISPTLICDNMAAQLMREKRVDVIIVGADRIAANGDTANKIGTYGLAILAQYHHVPFYVAAPLSTFDMKLENGSLIPIEQRHPLEVTMFKGEHLAPYEVSVYNPAFDVTPAKLITGIITDHGVIDPVDKETIKRVWVF